MIVYCTQEGNNYIHFNVLDCYNYQSKLLLYTGKMSKIPTRLVPPAPGLDFMGRVEVFYNRTWGTICDDRFTFFDASVVCHSLNFSAALCHVREAEFGQGTGIYFVLMARM